MTEIKVTRLNETTVRIKAEELGTTEDVENEYIGERIQQIMEDVEEATARAIEKGLTPEVDMAIEVFITGLKAIAIRYYNKEDFTKTAIFKTACKELQREIGKRKAREVIKKFLGEYFGRDIPDTLRSPTSTSLILPRTESGIPESK